MINNRINMLRERIERVLDGLLTTDPPSAELNEAMRYSVLGGGKRIRALLTYLSGQCLGAEITLLDLPAAAMELIHAYSLVHDDLPSMDDDAIRRGKASCHVAFGEATAILVGDALQSLAFAILSKPQKNLDPKNQLKMLNFLANNAGAQGMVGGQMLDLCNERQPINSTQLKRMHSLKTGALIRASVRLGAYVADCDEASMSVLDNYAQAIGFAFQIKDDLLDVESTSEILGKSTELDNKNNKASAIKTLGLINSKQVASELINKALGLLDQLPYDTKPLASLTQHLIKRTH